MEGFENPFTPTFGEAPIVLAGRSRLLKSLISAFRRSQRDPYLTTLITGARGTGKTSLLTVAGELAAEEGWIVSDVSAIPGMLEDIIERTFEKAAHLVVSQEDARVKGIGIGQVFSLELEYPPQGIGNWRTRMNRLLNQLAETDTGLLITVDEVTASLEEMVILASVYQHFVREGRKVALIMAGLPHNVSQLLQDKSVSFLRRAKQVQLGRISDLEVESAFRKTLMSAGKNIDDEDVPPVVNAIDGFPFMMQLVGYHSWENSTTEILTACQLAKGIELANREMKEEVLEASWKATSPKDRDFLAALAAGDSSVHISDIAERMGVSSSYAAQYKYRLLEQGLIEERETSVVDFALPALREFVIERMGDF